MSNRIIQLGNCIFTDGGRSNPNPGRVYDPNGICPTITTMGGGNREPMIIDDMYKNRKSIIYEDSCPALRSERSGLKVVIQKCGDRGGDGSYSVHDYSNCIPANPMSDRGQLLLEECIDD